MWNAGGVAARMIEIIAAGPVAEGQGGDLAQRYGLEFGEPDWLPDVISRYGLTPG